MAQPAKKTVSSGSRFSMASMLDERGSVKVDDVVDLSYVHDASQKLGPYVKKTATQ